MGYNVMCTREEREDINISGKINFKDRNQKVEHLTGSWGMQLGTSRGAQQTGYRKVQMEKAWRIWGVRSGQVSG